MQTTLHEFLQVGFVQVDLAGKQPRQLGGVGVGTHDFITEVSEPCRRGQADVAGTDDCEAFRPAESIVG